MPLSTKTWPHSLGLSACFRQWRAASHCRFLHGYALQFGAVFYAHDLDENGWVMDFGALKPIKAWLQETFDHRTMIAKDDPELDRFITLDGKLIQLNIVDRTGCEAFAKMLYERIDAFLFHEGYKPRVTLLQVTCREHEGNSAMWEKSNV